jgi:hypothetical protein
MFVLIPLLLKRGIGFWPSLAAGCVVTVLLYAGMTVVLGRFGVRL